MSDEFETPPMSGDNLPIRELKTQKESLEEKEETEEKKSKGISSGDKRRFYTLVGLVIFLVFLMGLGIGLLLKNKKPQPVVLPTPQPTIIPSPVATSSSWRQDLEDKIGKFENDLKNVDLKESQFLPPLLDFNIRFELKD